MVLEIICEIMGKVWRKVLSVFQAGSAEPRREPIGTVTKHTTSIQFVGQTGEERTPICPDCNQEIQIAEDSPDAWHLECGCSQTPKFVIERADGQ